jgi:hypothetical protein
MTTVNDDIRALLEGPPAPSLDSLEDVLTTGYAHALDLEGQRLRIERTLREVVREAGPPTPERDRRIAGLTSDLDVADRDLKRLRALLATLRKHVQYGSAARR